MNMIKRVLSRIWSSVKSTVKDLIDNIEAVVILSLAAAGLSFMLGQLPFVIGVPVLIETMFNTGLLLPTISTTLIIFLVWVMEKRHAAPIHNPAAL